MLWRVAPAAIAGGASVLFVSTWLAAETRTVEKPMFNGNRLAWCASWGADCGQPAAEAWCLAQGFAGVEAFVQAPGIGEKSPTRLIGTGAICDSADCDGFKEITCRKLDPAAPGGGAAASPPTPNPKPPAMEEAEAPPVDDVAPVPASVPDAAAVPTPVPAPEPEPQTAAALPGDPPGAPETTGATAAPEDGAPAPPIAESAADEAPDEDPGPPPPDAILLAAAGAPPIRPVMEIFTAPTFNGRRLDWCRGWKDACGKVTADEFCRLNGFVEALSFVPDPKIGAADPTRQIASGLVCDHDGCDGFAEIACRK